MLNRKFFDRVFLKKIQYNCLENNDYVELKEHNLTCNTFFMGFFSNKCPNILDFSIFFEIEEFLVIIHTSIFNYVIFY